MRINRPVSKVQALAHVSLAAQYEKSNQSNELQWQSAVFLADRLFDVLTADSRKAVRTALRVVETTVPNEIEDLGESVKMTRSGKYTRRPMRMPRSLMGLVGPPISFRYERYAIAETEYGGTLAETEIVRSGIELPTSAEVLEFTERVLEVSTAVDLALPRYSEWPPIKP